jgi:hypothetical protein
MHLAVFKTGLNNYSFGLNKGDHNTRFGKDAFFENLVTISDQKPNFESIMTSCIKTLKNSINLKSF